MAAEKKKTVTQAEFAKLMSGPEHSISQPAVAKLIRKGVLTPGADVGQWLVEYGRHMAKVAAGWQGADGTDRIKAAALLDESRREEIQLRIEKNKGKLISLEDVADAIQSLNGTIRGKLLGLPSRFRSLSPQLTAKQMDMLDSLIREILTELSHERFPPIIRASIRRYMADLSPTSEAEGGRVGG